MPNSRAVGRRAFFVCARERGRRRSVRDGAANTASRSVAIASRTSRTANDANERTNERIVRPSPRDLEFPHLTRWRARVVPAIVRSRRRSRRAHLVRARRGTLSGMDSTRASRPRGHRGSVAATSVARAGECRRASGGALTRTRGKSAAAFRESRLDRQGGVARDRFDSRRFTRQVFFRGGER